MPVGISVRLHSLASRHAPHTTEQQHHVQVTLLRVVTCQGDTNHSTNVVQPVLWTNGPTPYMDMPHPLEHTHPSTVSSQRHLVRYSRPYLLTHYIFLFRSSHPSHCRQKATLPTHTDCCQDQRWNVTNYHHKCKYTTPGHTDMMAMVDSRHDGSGGHADMTVVVNTAGVHTTVGWGRSLRCTYVNTNLINIHNVMEYKMVNCGIVCWCLGLSRVGWGREWLQRRLQ